MKDLKKHGGLIWLTFHVLGVLGFYAAGDPHRAMDLYTLSFLALEGVGLIVGMPMTIYARRFLRVKGDRSYFERFALFGVWLGWLFTNFTLYGWFADPAANFVLGVSIVGFWMWGHFFANLWG